nr:unnamed protein product [Digitaria exilis]
MVDRLDGSRSTSKGKSSSHRRTPSAKRQSSHYGSSAVKSKGTHRPREEPPRPARSQVVPPTDARHHINNIRAGRTRATSHTADSTGGRETPSSDALPCYTRTIRVSSFPRKFKPSGITKFDEKQDPNIWLRRYSSAIEAAGGDYISKMLYFPVAIEQGLLTWLESLCTDSIDSWHALKKAFVSNYQGSYERPGSKYELRACKKKSNESLCDYNRRFFAIKASCVPIPDSEVIDYFQEGMIDRSLFRDFGHNRPRDLEEFRELNGSATANAPQDDNKDQPRDSFKRNGNNPRKRPNNTVATVQSIRAAQTTQQRKEEFNKLLKKCYPYHPDNKHTMDECWLLLETFSKPNKKKKTGGDGDDKHDKGDEGFPDVNNTVNSVIPRAIAKTHDARHMQQNQRWSDTPITWSREDQWAEITCPGRYPLVLETVVANSKLTKVLFDGGSGLNLIFAKTLRQMGFDTSKLQPVDSPFYSIVPGKAAIPLGQITLPVTFCTASKYRTEYIKFEVTDFETSYHAIFGRPHGVLSLRGDIKRSYVCDKEAVEYAVRAASTIDQQELHPLAATVADEDGDAPTQKKARAIKPVDKVATKTVDLHTGDPTKTTESALVNFLRAQADIFATKPSDIPRAIKKELAKLLAAGFIKEGYLQDQLHRNVEAYVDDVVVKTRNPEDLIADLTETFDNLRNERGIEANPEKIEPIMNIEPPRTVKDVMKLTGFMAALNRFISKLGERGTDIEFRSCTAMKSQVLTDFISEWTEHNLPVATTKPEHWIMYFDGSLKLEGGVERANGMLLDGLKARMERTLKKAEGRWMKELFPVVWGLRLPSSWSMDLRQFYLWTSCMALLGLKNFKKLRRMNNG